MLQTCKINGEFTGIQAQGCGWKAPKEAVTIRFEIEVEGDTRRHWRGFVVDTQNIYDSVMAHYHGQELTDAGEAIARVIARLAIECQLDRRVTVTVHPSAHASISVTMRTDEHGNIVRERTSQPRLKLAELDEKDVARLRAEMRREILGEAGRGIELDEVFGSEVLETHEVMRAVAR